MSTENANTDQDLFLYDSEQLHALAPARVVETGLRWFKESRVTELERDEDNLWAQVEDPEREQPLSTDLGYDDAGNLTGVCGCGSMEEHVCAHAVAVLFQYAAQRDGTDAALLSARESALEERRQKGRTEVKVEHLGGEPWFGTWRAGSVGADPRFRRSYRVHIRSLREPANYCTCPDFAVNQLGTCKHIEAVLHHVGKRRDFERLHGQPAPYPYVYLDWNLENAPAIRLFRAGAPDEALQRLLDEHFDARGMYKGRLPDDFFRFAEAVAEREDIDLGEDAAQHARRLAEQAAHRVRAEEIRSRIGESGGRLPGIQARLYPYQTEGVAFLAANGRALLADDMGLGKTLQAIAAATWLRHHAGVERVLVICPASLKHQWAREIERFSGQPVQIVQGPPAERLAQYRKVEGFAVINYELVLRDLSQINEMLRNK